MLVKQFDFYPLSYNPFVMAIVNMKSKTSYVHRIDYK